MNNLIEGQTNQYRNDLGQKLIVDRLQHFQRYQLRYKVGLLVLFFTINAITLASSRIMEEMVNNQHELPFKTWEPFVWEFSSAFAILAFMPVISALLKSKICIMDSALAHNFGTPTWLTSL